MRVHRLEHVLDLMLFIQELILEMELDHVRVIEVVNQERIEFLVFLLARFKV